MGESGGKNDGGGRPKVKDRSAAKSRLYRAGRGHKKRAGGLSSLDFLPALFFKVAATYSPTCAVPSA